MTALYLLAAIGAGTVAPRHPPRAIRLARFVRSDRSGNSGRFEHFETGD